MALHLGSGSPKPNTVDMSFTTTEVRNGDHLKKIQAMMQKDRSANNVMGLTRDGQLLTNRQLQNQALQEVKKVSAHELAHSDAAGKGNIAEDKVHFSFQKNGNLLNVQSAHVNAKEPAFNFNNLRKTAENFSRMATAALAPGKLKDQIGEVSKPSLEDLDAHKQFAAKAKFAGKLADAEEKAGFKFSAEA